MISATRPRPGLADGLFFPLPEPFDNGTCDAGDVVARRHKKMSNRMHPTIRGSISPTTPIHRAEDPQGEDRSEPLHRRRRVSRPAPEAD